MKSESVDEVEVVHYRFRRRLRIALLLFATTIVASFFFLGFHQHLTLTSLKGHHQWLTYVFEVHPVATSLSYIAIFIAVTALSLPGQLILTLAGGAVFGFMWATVLVSISSTIGGTLAFLGSRFVFRESVRRRFKDRIEAIDRGIELEGGFYLFSVRLLPAIPFFITNLVMGLTRLPTSTFIPVSWIGMLPSNMVFVNAGTQLAKIDSIASIFSAQLLLSFALLAIFPWLARLLVRLLRSKSRSSENKP